MKWILIISMAIMIGCTSSKKCPEIPDCEKIKVAEIDRHTFLLGCVSGAVSASHSLHAPIPLGAVVYGCQKMYNSPKIKNLVKEGESIGK